jgi:hypothetical protein
MLTFTFEEEESCGHDDPSGGGIDFGPNCNPHDVAGMRAGFGRAKCRRRISSLFGLATFRSASSCDERTGSDSSASPR